jgi:hypothetical protein
LGRRRRGGGDEAGYGVPAALRVDLVDKLLESANGDRVIELRRLSIAGNDVPILAVQQAVELTRCITIG